MITTKRAIVASLLFSTFLFSQEGTIKASKFGKGIFNIVGADSTWSMKFAARMQFLSNSSWEASNNKLINPTQDFLVRRARLKFDGFAYSPKLKYKFELGLSNRDVSGGSQYTGNTPRYIFDAVVMWNFYGNFALWVGQTKLPGNIERVISSGNLQLVDRSLLNSYFNIDRDMGVQLRHHFVLGDEFTIREKIAISQGEGRNITTGNLGGHQYTARIELLPFGEFEKAGDYLGGDIYREPKPKLMLASTYDFNNNAVRTRSNSGTYMINDIGFYKTNIKTLFADAMFKYKGFSFMGEYALRDASNPFAKNSDGTLTGAIVDEGRAYNLQSGYLFKSNYEVAARYTNIKFDKDVTAKGFEKQVTLGLSKYVVGHKLKIQTDVSYLSSEIGNDEVMWRLQFDLHF
ncbi:MULTISPECIES: porin [Flavobacterium]|uniref:Porin n=1 Tax=Flavobacterium jumunjinense TaxID=998845 RepID=A0ABV5GNB4_9FLAO|nr:MULTISPECIES: porin [Flavobacterium]